MYITIDRDLKEENEMQKTKMICSIFLAIALILGGNAKCCSGFRSPARSNY